MKRRTAAAVAVFATAACTRYVSGPPPTATSAPAAPTAQTTATVELQPGPHSAIADVDLPEGTVQCTTIACKTGNLPSNDPHKEWWRYSAPYDDTVAFLQKRFATGRRYDTHGATWWNGLPPCYDTNHHSPPWGWTHDDFIEWVWSDGAMTLDVEADKPGIKTSGGDIVPFGRILISSWAGADMAPEMCYRA